MAYTDIDKPSDYFNTILHSGNGTDPYSFTGVGFQPDLIWGKGRNNTFSHVWFDSVRGVNKYLSSNSTNAELTNPSSGYLSSFDTDGYTVVAGTSNFANFNDNTINTPSTYAFWNWLAGGTASSNTDGSITSTVSANTTSGFSIVSYTGNGTAGATVGHGLGVKPATIIIKARSKVGQNWIVWHQTFPNNNDYIELNTTDAKDTYDLFNNTAPTSSVFSLSSDGNVNSNTDTYIAYCFAEKKGFSKFGSYTGNGNADGTFIYTGFKPAMIIVKRTDTTGSWVIYDNKRDTFNPADAQLVPSSSEAEATSERFDFLSNGFKLITTTTRVNASGGSYIYMAFASNPFVTSTGIPCTAR